VIALTAAWLRCPRPVALPWVRLVCFPHAGGTAAFYRSWLTDLPPDVELHSVQYPGRLDRITEPTMDDMDRMADALADAVGGLLDRPVALFGHSMGAAVAYEVARRMPARVGAAPVRLFVSGRPAPDRHRPGSKHLADDDVLWDELRRLGGAGPEVLDNAELREACLPTLRGDYRLIETYRPRPEPLLRCPVSVLVGDADTEVSPAEARSWAGSTRAAFTQKVFSGGHFYLAQRQPEVVDEVVTRLLESVPRRPTGLGGP
jgi:pyochelin biosynthesis protein PchC